MNKGRFSDYLHSDIFFAIMTIAVVWLALMLREVLFVVFVAFLLTTALLPLVRLMKRAKLPRSLITVVLLVLLLALVFGTAYLAAPAFIRQFASLVENLPNYFSKVSPFLSQQNIDVGRTIQSYLQGAAQSLVGFSTAAFGVLGAIVSIVVISLYWVLDYDAIRAACLGWLSDDNQKLAGAILSTTERRLGSWVRGQLILSGVIAVLDLAAYLIIGLPAAFMLAVLAGLFESVPMVGPVLAAIPAVLIALSISVHKAVAVLVVYILIQVVESHLLAPKVMGRAVGLHPLTIIIAFLAAAKLAGLVGVLIAIPATLALLSTAEAIRNTNHAV